MRYLITSNTLFDQAGVAMIRGTMNGMSKLDGSPEFAALVGKDHTSDNPICTQYVYPKDNEKAFRWADIVLDVGGFIKGKSKQRMQYKKLCDYHKIPYVIMSQSFLDPNPELLKDVPVIARGKNAAMAVKRSIGKAPIMAADLGFLVEPEPMGTPFLTGFTTHWNKPFQPMYDLIDDKSLQIRWKLDRKKVWEPPLFSDPSRIWHGEVEALYGIIGSLKELHTARYHSAVAAILAGISKNRVHLYVTFQPKYDDLMDWVGCTEDQLIESAMISCEIAYNEVKKWN